jgi:hypothetical protein
MLKMTQSQWAGSSDIAGAFDDITSKKLFPYLVRQLDPSAIPPHYHRTDEYLCLVEGRMTFWHELSTERCIVNPGNALVVPAGLIHRVVVNEPSIYVMGLKRPLGMDGFQVRVDEGDFSRMELIEINYEIARAEQSQNDSFFNDLLAEEFEFHRAIGGTSVNKHDYLLGLVDANNSYAWIDAYDIAVETYGDFGIVTMMVTAKGTRGGKPFEGQYVNARMYQREARKWTLAKWANWIPSDSLGAAI